MGAVSLLWETLVWLHLMVNLGRRRHHDHRAGNFYPHMWRHASFKLLLTRRSNWPSRQMTDRLGSQEEWHCCRSDVTEANRRCAGIRWRVELFRCWPDSDASTERKLSQRKPQLLFVGPFFRPGFKTHHWRCSSSWEDRMPRRKSSFRTFTKCSNLLSLSANKLLFSGYQATDIGHTSLFLPCRPVTAHLLLSPCSFIRGVLLCMATAAEESGCDL